MASTAPVKSQALHNFALSPLKWKNNHPRGQSRSQSPMREVLGKGKGLIDVKNQDLDSLRNGVFEKDCCDDQIVEKSETKASLSSNSRNSDSKESRSKLLIRIPAGMQKNGENKGRVEVEVDEVSMDGRKGEEGEGGEGDEREGKIWNLRPRKAVKKSLNVNGGGGGVVLKIGGQGKSDVLQKGNVESGSRIKVGSDVGGLKKKDTKVKFSVSLTRGEIEEDVFSFTGSKPSRRPKKRAKVVQKQLDNLFPGLWLASVTPDSYKVSENYMKG